MTMNRRNRRIVTILIVILGVYLLPVELYVLSLIWPDLQGVRQAGICPALPGDSEAYPCTLGQFLNRMYFSPFALTGKVFMYLYWGFIATPLLIGVLVLKHFYQRWRNSYSK